MIANKQFSDLLERGDVNALRTYLLSFGGSVEDVEELMHKARTEAENISFKARAYSHAWLVERGLTSMLPEELKPKAQRLYPVIAETVAISMNFKSKFMKPAEKIVEKAMSNAVADIYANGDQANIELTRKRIQEAKSYEIGKLFGNVKGKIING